MLPAIDQMMQRIYERQGLIEEYMMMCLADLYQCIRWQQLARFLNNAVREEAAVRSIDQSRWAVDVGNSCRMLLAVDHLCEHALI